MIRNTAGERVAHERKTGSGEAKSDELASLWSDRSLAFIRDYVLPIGALCYLAGFVVNTLYLGRYSIVNFDVLRAKYVLSGGLFITFDALWVYGVSKAWRFLTRIKSKRNPVSLLLTFATDTVILAALVLAIYLVFLYIPAGVHSHNYYRNNSLTSHKVEYDRPGHEFFGSFVRLYLYAAIVPYCVIVVLGMAVVCAERVIAHPRLSRSAIGPIMHRTSGWLVIKIKSVAAQSRSERRFLVIAVVVSGSFGLAILYANTVYATIPQQIGGGRPIVVTSVVFNEDGLDKVVDLDVYTVSIIDRTSDRIILLLARKPTVKASPSITDEFAIEVKRDDVTSLQYTISDANILSDVAQSQPPQEPTSPTAKWRTQIQQAADESGVPAHLIEAIVQVESGGDPTITGPGGTIGLMQLNCEVWSDICARYGDPREPLPNLEAGAEILNYFYGTCNQSWDGAISGYFSGRCTPTGASDGVRTDQEYVDSVKRIEHQLDSEDSSTPMAATPMSS